MILKQKTENFRIFRHLLTAGIFFLVIQLTSWYIQWYQNPEHLYSDFKSDFSKLEEDLKNSTKLLMRSSDSSSGKNPISQLNIKSRLPEVPDISLFIFHNDTLKWWNSNQEIFPGKFPGPTFGEFQVLQLPNGWYAFSILKTGSRSYVAGSLIKNEYSVRNDYLRNYFSKRFTLPETVQLSTTNTGYPVFSNDGKYLFGLLFKVSAEGHSKLMYLTQTWKTIVEIWFLICFLGAAVSLILFLDVAYKKVQKFIKPLWLVPVFFIGDISLLRAIQFYFKFPAPLYQSELFSPAWYSSSFLLPTPGDFLINAILILAIALGTGKFVPQKNTQNPRWAWRVFLYFLFLVLLLAIFILTGYLISNLIINSSFPLNFQNIAELIPASFYGLLIVTVLLAALFKFSETLLSWLRMFSDKISWLIPGILGCFLAYILFCLVTGIKPDFLLMLLFSLYLGFFRKSATVSGSSYSWQNMIFLIFFFALFATLTLNKANTSKETDKIDLLALDLSSKHNPVTEDRYDAIAAQIKEDKILRNMIRSVAMDYMVPDSLDSYLKKTYFNDYWRRYNIQVTVCRPGNQLRVQPQGYLIDCNLLFKNLIRDFGEPTGISGLHYLDYGFGKEFYLAQLNVDGFRETGENSVTLFLEFSLNGTIPDPGYPGLLLDQAQTESPELKEYSYAIYQQGKLVQSVGAMNYPLELTDFGNRSKGVSTFVENDFNHFHFRIDEDSDLLISKKHLGFLAILTPFSYFFTFFALIGLALTGYSLLKRGLKTIVLDLRIKLQLSLTGMLILTMIIIGMVQIIYIININQKKNHDYLREKAYSVKTEVQHKYGTDSSVAELLSKEPGNFLIKLSNVFFTDINFYDPRGFLVASSRDKIFREGLISERINPVAYHKMILEHNSLLIHEEEIGAMKFASGYLPLYNDQGTLLGYINLPYFARQDELKREISSFLVTFVNIYIILILLGVMISILISNYITSPLALLSGKMSRLRLGTSNEKIIWKNNDEIGRLVADYNRMIDELELSALQMAKTERESAWREMARQVAHEIKNPLTPMKLSAQYLQRAWNDRAPDMDQRITKFTRTLVEQIDTLAAIASDFSDFARMPQPVPEILDLSEIIQTVLSWYPESSAVKYIFDQDMGNFEIMADRSRMTRVLTNLINNAVHAIGSDTQGIITISLNQEVQGITLEVADNGSGIPADLAGRIFQPDFTTKSGGMGLGLAIVKGIIVEMGGEISFKSNRMSGTTFVIRLPESHINSKI